ncbi:MAG TPA: 2-oxoacid:acceptor oxidoreductase family protein [Opitutales bacterium]|nr:2-oxoacid:acceptor oxidoreductase family protein [Opitutales bacterium]
MKTVNVFFCGTGGQGVLKAAEICAVAAMHEGYHVKKSEVHGMAQRGGSVESHVRFGGEVFSPLIPAGDADVMMGFDAAEAARLRGILKTDGADITGALARAGDVIHSPLFINTFMLGVLSKHVPISEASWLSALREVFAGKQEAENERVFRAAREVTI